MKKHLLVVLFSIFVLKGFSQCYSVTQITYAPDSFNVGTVVTSLLDDHYTCMMNLPFSFCFYGNTCNRFMIGSNGDISFDSTYACSYDTWPISAAIPTPANLHRNCIMFPWEDLDLMADTSSRICYNTYGITPNRRFVVSFYHAPLYQCITSEFTGEVVLYESSGIVDMFIQNKPLCVAWNGGYSIEGMQNNTGTMAVAVPGRNYPAQWTANNDAWRFTPSCNVCSSAGIANATEKNSFELFPNPASNEIHLKYENSSAQKFSVELEDFSGRIIYRDEFSSQAERTLKPNVASGIYFVRLINETGETLEIKKLAIE